MGGFAAPPLTRLARLAPGLRGFGPAPLGSALGCLRLSCMARRRGRGAFGGRLRSVAALVPLSCPPAAVGPARHARAVCGMPRTFAAPLSPGSGPALPSLGLVRAAAAACAAPLRRGCGPRRLGPRFPRVPGVAAALAVCARPCVGWAGLACLRPCCPRGPRCPGARLPPPPGLSPSLLPPGGAAAAGRLSAALVRLRRRRAPGAQGFRCGGV